MSGWICARCGHFAFWATIANPEGQMYGRCRKDLDEDEPEDCSCPLPVDSDWEKDWEYSSDRKEWLRISDSTIWPDATEVSNA